MESGWNYGFRSLTRGFRRVIHSQKSQRQAVVSSWPPHERNNAQLCGSSQWDGCCSLRESVCEILKENVSLCECVCVCKE